MKNHKSLTLRLPEDLLERIRAAAEEDLMGVSTWARVTFKEKLDERDRLTKEARGAP